MCKKLGKMFSLLPLVSASHFVLAYSIQCFTIFLIYCTNLEQFIDFKSITNITDHVKGEAASDDAKTLKNLDLTEKKKPNQELLTAYNENPLHYFPTFFKHWKNPD